MSTPTRSDLLQVSSGIFRPEYESGAFVRVQQAGADAWEIRDKSGTTWRLGGAGYEEAEGANVATYLPSQALDLHGHAIAFTWDASSGYALLQRVVWNDHGDSARNEVVLAYEARPDPHVLFGNGIRQSLARRLTAIDVRHGGQLVRRYALTYGQDVRIDRDGFPDLLVTGGTTGQYRSYLNQDGTAWREETDRAASQSPSASLASVGVELADLDYQGQNVVALPPTCTVPAQDVLGIHCAAYGGQGGNGGAGGAGGRGGAGAGGWSIGVLIAAGAGATADAATVFSIGRARTGGLGNGGGHAPSGVAARIRMLGN